MNQPHGEEIVLVEALRLAPEQRSAYLDQATCGNAALRQRVESLLESYQNSDFLEQAAAPAFRQAVVSIPLTEKAGDKIGRYKLLQQIGRGGCGVVYLAEQEEPVRRRVALKIIKLGMDTKNVIARFEAERQALAMMDHPNIAKVLDAGATETGRPYFVMELVRGVKITDYCDATKLPTRQRLDLFNQVCQAIQHAHQKGVIHRDIKPSNILVTINDGVPVPKVIDFGIAKATGGQRLTDKTVLTAFQQFIGTPAYMSPEQAMMTSVDIDTRSDIYSLGVLLYELLTGTTPFDAKELLAAGLEEMRRTIREKEPERPSTRFSTLPDDELSTTAHRRGLDAPKLISQLRGDLDWIVMKALEKDRARRYESANGLAMDLQRHLNNEPVVARPPSNLYRFQKLVRRNKLAFAAASAVIAALIIGLTVSAMLFFKEKAARVRAVAAETQMQRALAEAKQQRDETLRQKLRADEQAAVAKAVEGFLQNDLLKQADSLAQADRGFEQQPDLTVKEAFRRAAERIGQRFTNQPLVEAEIQQTLGAAFTGVGEAKLAIPHLERAVALRKEIGGPDAPNILISMDKLAKAYGSDGRVAEAVSLFEEVLTRAKAKFGPEDVGTASAMSSLAVSYYLADRFAEALPLFEQALKLWRAKLGPDHPDTLVSMYNVAITHRALGQLAEALPLFQETLKLRKAKLGPDHPQTLRSILSLAVAYSDSDRLSEALPLFEETLKLQKNKLGPDHPDTLESMNHLALAYKDAGRLSEALPLFEETLKLQKAKLGLDHPNTLRSMGDLASAYKDAGRLAEALPLFEETLRLRKAKLGPDHPDTLGSMNHLASAYQDAGRSAEALPLYEETLRLRKAKFGPDHPDTLVTMNDLAVVYSESGRLAEALQLDKETLKLRKAKLGADHPDTLGSMNNLADAYETAGRLTEAILLFEETLKLARTKLGPKHPITLTIKTNLLYEYAAAGRLAEEEPIFNDLLTPPSMNQAQTATDLRSRAIFLAGHGRWKEAAADLVRVIELNPDDHQDWHGLAALLVQTGELGAYREHCRKSLERFADTTDPATAHRIAKDCLILPSFEANLETVRKMVDNSLMVGTNHSHWMFYSSTKALAEYRQVRFASAVDWAGKLLSSRSVLPQSRWPPSAQVETYAVLAMGRQQLKQNDLARSALANGQEIADNKLPKLENGFLGMDWLDWIIAHALMREAEALIKGNAEASAETK